ncbi:MAG: hypothetical protein ABFS23_13145, partial [Pseudomonadota bacterium]
MDMSIRDSSGPDFSGAGTRTNGFLTSLLWVTLLIVLIAVGLRLVFDISRLSDGESSKVHDEVRLSSPAVDQHGVPAPQADDIGDSENALLEFSASEPANEAEMTREDSLIAVEVEDPTDITQRHVAEMPAHPGDNASATGSHAPPIAAAKEETVGGPGRQFGNGGEKPAASEIEPERLPQHLAEKVDVETAADPLPQGSQTSADPVPEKSANLSE